MYISVNEMQVMCYFNVLCPKFEKFITGGF